MFRLIPRSISFGVLAVAMMASTADCAERMAIERDDEGLRITIDGKPFANYVVESGTKPIVYPIYGPTGQELTRNYPMREVEGERRDHPHHRSMWFTHGEVNGVDFWAEGAKKGKVVHREFLKSEIVGDKAVIQTTNDWINTSGKKVCEDVRTLAFHGDGERRMIDFDITIKASEGPVKFGDTKEGTMALRVPSALDVKRADGKPGGTIVNSHGQTNSDAWGKQAAWVDYQGTLDGTPVGIAMLNHPTSFRFPTYWHVRDYGLLAANPFGVHDFRSTKGEEGAHHLKAGESVTFRYRVLLHKGDEKAGGVAEAFEAYSRETD